MENMFPLCQTNKPTGARGLTPHMSSLANEVKTVCLRDENNWFPHSQYHRIYARYRPRVLVCCWQDSIKQDAAISWQYVSSSANNWHVMWWHHQIETFSALLALCAGISPVTGEFPSQRPVTWNFGVFFDLRLNKRLSKQSWGWWLETTSRSLWRRCNDLRT